MRRTEGDAEPPPARLSRRQVKASEEDLDRIERRLERMPLEREALTLAMGQFGEGFTP